MRIAAAATCSTCPLACPDDESRHRFEPSANKVLQALELEVAEARGGGDGSGRRTRARPTHAMMVRCNALGGLQLPTDPLKASPCHQP